MSKYKNALRLSFRICSGSRGKPFVGQAKVFTHGANTSSQVSQEGWGWGAIIQATVSKVPPLKWQADSLACGLFTFTSVNPDWEHYSKQAAGIWFVSGPPELCEIQLALFGDSGGCGNRVRSQHRRASIQHAPFYASSRYRETLAWIWSRASGHPV